MRNLLEHLTSLPPGDLPRHFTAQTNRRTGHEDVSASLRASLDSFLASILPQDALLSSASGGSRTNDPLPNHINSFNALLTDLRNFSPHSFPFLNRVSKRDAPGYYEIIKKPMDLNKVGRNIKMGLYSPATSVNDPSGSTGKERLAADLALIWSNCFEYNTAPDHPLRREAELMKKKTLELLEFVPDLEKDHGMKRDGKEVEGVEKIEGLVEKSLPGQTINVDDDGLEDSDDDADAEGDNEDEDPVTIEASRTKTGAPVSARVAATNRKSTKAPSAAPPASLLIGQARDHGSRATSAQLEDVDLSRPPSPPPSQDSYSRPKTDSLSYMINQRLLGKRKLGEDEPTSLWERDRKESLSKHILVSRSREGMAAQMKSSIAKSSGPKHNGLEDVNEANLLKWASEMLEPLALVNEIPPIPDRQVWSDEATPVRHSLSSYAQVQLGLHSGGLQRKISRNIARLRRVRRLYHQCWLAQEGELPMDEIPENVPARSEDEAALEDEADSVPSHSPLLDKSAELTDIGSQAALDCMKQVMSHLCLQAGFEASHQRPLQILAEIGCEAVADLAKRLSNMAHGLKKHKAIPKLGIVHNVLDQGLGQSVFGLRDYIRKDIDKCGYRLADLECRLRSKLNGVLEDNAIDDKDLAAETNTNFVDGGFLQDLGEDFFGFRSLGLDQEFGLNSLSVPRQILRGRARGETQNRSFDGDTALKGDEESFHEEEVSFVPLVEDAIVHQIGLMQPFYGARLLTPRQLIDDDLLPAGLRPERTKLPYSIRQGGAKKTKFVPRSR